jgi:phosphatidylserine/phosphatidylglycerophosphate/cardiolipin synthase-like enzyme
MVEKKNSQVMKIYEDNDRYFDKFWEYVDRAQDIICITTYDMDHKNIAGITLQKLRNASIRGVRVFLIVDDLNFYANKDEIRALEAVGGTVIRHNPFRKFYYHLLRFKVSTIF